MFPIARYRFEFEVLTPIHLPEYAGSMLRGAFGNALRRTACMTRERDCKACALYRTCPYPAIFETPPPAQHDLQKFSQIPNPYIIEPPAWGERVYQVGETLCFNMVLVGLQAQLALITYAWQRAFAHQVGHGTARLQHIYYVGQDGEAALYDPVRERLLPHTPSLHLHPTQPSDVHLHFTTPLRLQINGRPLREKELTARDLLMTLARRISLLLELQTGQNLGLDFSQLAAQAAAVSDSRALHWQDWTRYSSRQQQTMQLGGVVGDWTFHQLPTAFQHLLQLGQWVHVGKNATFGLGRYGCEKCRG